MSHSKVTLVELHKSKINITIRNNKDISDETPCVQFSFPPNLASAKIYPVHETSMRKTPISLFAQNRVKSKNISHQIILRYIDIGYNVLKTFGEYQKLFSYIKIQFKNIC